MATVNKVDYRRRTGRRHGQADHLYKEVRRLVDDLVCRRHQMGLSQVELAGHMGTNQRTLSQLETMNQEPKLGTAVAWADALGLRLTWSEKESVVDSTAVHVP
jgi:ribosome-binding protein aMBF1 (putative translation factor)